MCVFLAVWAGRRVFFCCLGGPGRRRVFSFAGEGWGDGVRVVFFCLDGPGRGRVAFAIWAGGRVLFFAVWTGRFFCLLLFGRGACVFVDAWVGDGSSFIYRSAWLGFKGPNIKKRSNSKTKTRVPTLGALQTI